MILFLSDVAGSEILLILVFVLMFFGSKSIPNLAKTLGKAMHQIKSASNEIQNEIKKSGMDIKKDMNLDGIFKSTTDEITTPIISEVKEVENYINTPAGVKAYGSDYNPEPKDDEHIIDENLPLDQQTIMENLDKKNELRNNS
jgi:TatA/E family protein of Tat protein translocase